MDTKLTLKLDKEVIEQAKKYAKERRTSLSRLVEDFFTVLLRREGMPDEELTGVAGMVAESSTTYRSHAAGEVSPLVKDLTGVVDLDDVDYRESYTDYLNRKYS